MTMETSGATRKTRYQPIGRVEPTGEPTIADDGARAWAFAAPDGTRAEVGVLAEDVARVRLLPAGVTPAHSWATVERIWPAVAVRTDEGEGGKRTLTTDAMRVEIATEPFRVSWSWPDGTPFAEDDPALGMGIVPPLSPTDALDALLPPGSVRCHKRLASGERILGAGERTSRLDRRGDHLV
jgi:hypothetical protein